MWVTNIKVLLTSRLILVSLALVPEPNTTSLCAQGCQIHSRYSSSNLLNLDVSLMQRGRVWTESVSCWAVQPLQATKCSKTAARVTTYIRISVSVFGGFKEDVIQKDVFEVAFSFLILNILCFFYKLLHPSMWITFSKNNKRLIRRLVNLRLVNR